MRKYFLVVILTCCINYLSAQKQIIPAPPINSALVQGKATFLNDKPNQKVGKKPNIILIVADDLGKYDLSVYGNVFIKTPNIDKLAREGALFTDGYSSAAICSPSRAGLMTGRYQQRFGFHLQPHQRYPNNKTEWKLFKNLINTGDLEPAEFGPYPAKGEVSKNGLPQSEITLAELLKSNGYATAWIGKWHLGYAEPMLPKNFGFDYRYGFYEAFSLFAYPNDKTIVNARIKEFTDKHIWNGGRKGPCAIRENEKEIIVKEYITYAFANKAIEFIEKNKEHPFFIYLPLNAPHTPYQAPKNIYDKLVHIKEHNKRVYYSMIVAMDSAVGNIMNKLKEVNLDENTLIIFTSDNGAALYSNTVTNEPLSGGKMTLFEGGINVPFIMYYKGFISPRTVVQHPVNQCDILPTVASVANITLPQDRLYDGVSLLQWIVNPKKIDAPHEALYWLSDYNMAIRSGDLKLIINTADKTLDLFNLKSDKSELKNISASSYTDVQRLKGMLEKWVAQMPPLYWPRIMDYRIQINGKPYRWAV